MPKLEAISHCTLGQNYSWFKRLELPVKEAHVGDRAGYSLYLHLFHLMRAPGHQLLLVC